MKEKLSKGHQVEYDINLIIEDCVRKYDVPSDFLGDSYPEEINDIMVKMRVSKSVEEYAIWLDEIRELICYYAKTYEVIEEWNAKIVNSANMKEQV